MNATGASRFRLGACLFEWRLHPRGRARAVRCVPEGRARPSVAAAERASSRSAPAEGSGAATRGERCARSRSAPTCYRFGDRRLVRCAAFACCCARPRGELSRRRRGAAVAQLLPRGASRLARCARHHLYGGGRVASSVVPPSNEARLPAELKHITKRRRRN